jgi:ribosomal protein S12 methylthiotransferase
MRFAILTLGCDKNSVDSERYLAELVAHGGEYTDVAEEADLILVNTCGFIDAAKQESIDTIVEAGRLKEEGGCRAVIAVGCMVERHRTELEQELPEVDLFLGTSDVDRLIPELVSRGLVPEEERLIAHPGTRLYAGELAHVRYLKVSEGCDHGCAFCAIPLMRGKHRSFEADAIVREAQLLELQGAREINLVAQDLAHYGRDRRDGLGLPELLERLVRETDIPWIRLLYLYSQGITPRLLEVMSGSSRIVPYLDMPIQHGSDAVLARMRRPERNATIRQRVRALREGIPDVAVRTTCIVGFPGETPADFEQLLELLGEVRFERVGAFTYSAQEGTRAAELEDDVPLPLKLERLERLTDLQRSISAEQYERHIGRVVPAMVDRPDPAAALAQARVLWQADDIDGITHVTGSAPAGSLVRVRLDDVVDEVDFRATLIDTISEPAQQPTSRRSLPLLAGISQATFGR